VVGKKIEAPNRPMPPRVGTAPQAPRAGTTGAVRSEPPMDVDPTELIPTIPPAGQAAQNQAPVAIADVDLEEDSETLMFKRPEPAPRRPPPPKAMPAAPSGKPMAKPPLPPPTRVDKPSLAGAKSVDRRAPPPPKPVVKPPPPKSPEKPILAAPPAPSAPREEPKLSERPLFEVTLGSEQPGSATPEAGEISLFGPKSPPMPLLAAPQASDLGSLDLKPQKPGAFIVLPMPDFSRDVGAIRHSSPPHGIGSRIVDFGRAHAKWFVMSGATLLIATASWAVFQAAASSDTAAAPPAAGTAARSPVSTTTPTAPATAPMVTAEPVAPAPAEPAPPEKAEVAEAPAAAPTPAADPASAEVAARPGALPRQEAPSGEAAAERAERTAPVAAVDPVAKPSRATGTSERASSRSSDSTNELPATKAAPEPVPAPAPAAPVAAPSVGGFDGTADFDQSAAMAALRQAAESAKRCHTPDAPSGGVRIAVTFARSGAVSATQVEGGVAGTPLGDCVVAKFQSVHVPPFRGSVMTVRKTVMF
jgi:hypothetical protein